MTTTAGVTALQFAQMCNSVPGSTQVPGYAGYWDGACWDGSHGGTLNFNSYNHWVTPNKFTCLATNSWGGSNWPGGGNDALTATSNHPGGVNVAFCDGSVHFIKDSISPQVWWALGSRNVGETIGSDQY